MHLVYQFQYAIQYINFNEFQSPKVHNKSWTDISDDLEWIDKREGGGGLATLLEQPQLDSRHTAHAPHIRTTHPRHKSWQRWTGGWLWGYIGELSLFSDLYRVKDYLEFQQKFLFLWYNNSEALETI